MENTFETNGFRVRILCPFQNRVSRLVMACANRTEIVRKAILNCSTDLFDPSRSFVFHILSKPA